MRYAVSFLGCLVAALFTVASAIMNWSFGLSLGKTPFEGQVYGAVSVGADAFKTLLPFLLFWSVRNLRLEVTLAAGLMWVLCAAYAIVSGVGFAASNRSASVASHATQASVTSGWQEDLARADVRLKALGVFDAREAIEKKIETLRQDRKFGWSNKCTQTNSDTREFCAGLRETEANFARAKEGERLEAQITELRLKLADRVATGTGQEEGIDVQANTISRVFKVDLSTVNAWLAILMVALVEVCSTFGFFVALNHGEFQRWRKTAPVRPVDTIVELQPVAPVKIVAVPAEVKTIAADRAVATEQKEPVSPRMTQATEVSTASKEIRKPGRRMQLVPTQDADVRRKTEPRDGDIADFIVAHMSPDTSEVIEISRLYPHYVTWCRTTAAMARPASEFEDLFVRMLDAAKLTHELRGGKRYSLDLQLKSKAA
jgi:hypothetical protein